MTDEINIDGMTELELAQLAHEHGGILFIPLADGGIRAIFAIDQNDPGRTFDRINEVELELVREADHNIDRIMKAGEFCDGLRECVREGVNRLGVHLER